MDFGGTGNLRGDYFNLVSAKGIDGHCQGVVILLSTNSPVHSNHLHA